VATTASPMTPGYAGGLASNKSVALGARGAPHPVRPYPSEAMRAYRVSTAVNSVKNDGPECGEPIAG